MNGELPKTLQLQTLFEAVPDFNSDSLLKIRMRICHTGRNPNGSFFTLSGFEYARPTLPNRPILALVEFDADGQPQFGPHAMHLEEDYKGEMRAIYDETPIGLIPETNNYSIEEYQGRVYVCADGYIWKDYANYATDIFERDGKTNVSMEIFIEEAQFEKKYNSYLISKYQYRGVTCIGGEPGMIGAGAEVASFENRHTEFFEKIQTAIAQEFAAQKEDPTLPQEAINMDENNKAIPTFQEDSAEGSEPETTEEETVPTEEPAVTESEEQEKEEAPQEEDAPAQEEDSIEEPAGENSETFSLINQVRKQISQELRAYAYEDADGNQYFEYTLEDLDTEKQLVYVFSFKDLCYYSAPYVIKGDAVSLVPNFRKQVICFRDFEGGDTDTSSAVFTALRKDKERLAAKYDEAVRQLEELKAFQQKIELERKQAAIQAIADQFEELAGNEEFEALKSKGLEYEVADFEKECYALRGKYAPVKFANPQKKQGAYQAFANTATPKQDGLAEIRARYLQN